MVEIKDDSQILIQNAIEEIKINLRFIFKLSGINQPPYGLMISDKKGDFIIDFIPKTRRRK